jgi:hypothetical protein
MAGDTAADRAGVEEPAGIVAVLIVVACGAISAKPGGGRRRIVRIDETQFRVWAVVGQIADGFGHGDTGGASLVARHAGGFDTVHRMHHATGHLDLGDLRKARVVTCRAVDDPARVDGRLGDAGLAAVETVKAAKALSGMTDRAGGTDFLVLVPVAESLGRGICMGGAKPIRNRLVVLDLDFLGIERTGFGYHKRNDHVFAGKGDIGHISASFAGLCDTDMSEGQSKARSE